MESNSFLDTTRKITRLILTNQKKMNRKDDLKNLCESLDFDKVINEVNENLSKLGFDLYSTSFLDQQYYILTSEGKDDNITPSQYGTLALILALSKETDENINLTDLKEIFSEVWESDVEFLIKNDYLRKIKIEDLDILKVTPLGKAIMKNIIHDLQLKNLLNVFKEN